MTNTDLDEHEPPVAFEVVTPFVWPARHGGETLKAWQPRSGQLALRIDPKSPNGEMVLNTHREDLSS